MVRSDPFRVLVSPEFHYSFIELHASVIVVAPLSTVSV